MKTKWGTCNPDRGMIWLNLELAKKPPECLEYVVVHEMIHLLERNHTRRFYELMDRFMPSWRIRRETLNRGPLADEKWNHGEVPRSDPDAAGPSPPDSQNSILPHR
jgi:predicted metal-dependent hydrolase